MKRTRREAAGIAVRNLGEIVKRVDGAGYGHIALCMETMGKINQFGDLDEVLELCQVDERLLPCVDFSATSTPAPLASWTAARGGGPHPGPDARRAGGGAGIPLPQPTSSCIQFTPGGGEKVHLTFAQEEYGPAHEPLMRALAERGWSPTIISNRPAPRRRTR